MAKSHDTSMNDILKGVANGTTRLPDFQRGWVWDDERIRGLIASITSSYPMGAVMFLECGDGDGLRFKSRAFTNVPDDGKKPELLVLDGQQRLTSVYCAMCGKDAVPTQTAKKERVERFYYLDIRKCLDEELDRIDGVISVPDDKTIKEDFGRKIVQDLRTANDEYREHMFPLNIIYDAAATNVWKNGYRKFHKFDETIIERLDKFDEQIVNPVILYTLPVIQLDKFTPKEAVCQVFENVNTGGVALTVFELVTATFASGNAAFPDGFSLREDWFGKEDENGRNVEKGRADKMKKAEGTFKLLSVVSSTDFLTAMTLLAQVKGGRTLSCKRKDVLALELDDYTMYADELMNGFIAAARFLVQQSILLPRDLPYTTQFIPLSVLMSVLGNRAEDGAVKAKLANWYWCGVFGEMYGAANETRYANDVTDVLAWLDGGDVPDTVSRAFFQPTRLLSLQTRNGAAYKGVMALILDNGAQDFISGSKMDFTNFISESVDIHHIFPKKYCEGKGYDWRKWNSIVNKTPLTARTNRTIGGVAPSEYLKYIENNEAAEKVDVNVATHGIDATSLRTDDFDAFFALRSKTLLDLIGRAMGKRVSNLDSQEVVETFGRSLG